MFCVVGSVLGSRYVCLCFPSSSMLSLLSRVGVYVGEHVCGCGVDVVRVSYLRVGAQFILAIEKDASRAKESERFGCFLFVSLVPFNFCGTRGRACAGD